MLTLKVVSLDYEDQTQTSLFYGESIQHIEQLEKISDIKKYKDARYIGSIINESSEQELVLSQVWIYNSDNSLKDYLLILPKSDCFIMENGKTVDTFYSHYSQFK